LTFPVILAIAAVAIVIGFVNLGLITIAGTGVIFRVQDANNYYILRAKPLEGNVNLYKYASGRRSLINEGSARVNSGEWQELQVQVVGTRFTGLSNGVPVVEARDDDYVAGRVSLWTKADSVTCFDDVVVSPQ
jgi:hypothetical protein